jgi:anti-sigma factor RsiW
MHLTDEQLNEYLDDEIEDRAHVEKHVASCKDCATRLTALQALFDELESLPDLALSTDLAVAITRRLSREDSLPRSLRLILILQAVAAVVAILVAAPFLVQWISPYLSLVQVPSLADIFLDFQWGWRMWLDTFSLLQPPALPDFPAIELSSLFMIVIVISVSLLWLVGNRFLLRKQTK